MDERNGSSDTGKGLKYSERKASDKFQSPLFHLQRAKLPRRWDFIFTDVLTKGAETSQLWTTDNSNGNVNTGQSLKCRQNIMLRPSTNVRAEYLDKWRHNFYVH